MFRRRSETASSGLWVSKKCICQIFAIVFLGERCRSIFTQKIGIKDCWNNVFTGFLRLFTPQAFGVKIVTSCNDSVSYFLLLPVIMDFYALQLLM